MGGFHPPTPPGFLGLNWFGFMGLKVFQSCKIWFCSFGIQLWPIHSECNIKWMHLQFLTEYFVKLCSLMIASCDVWWLFMFSVKVLLIKSWCFLMKQNLRFELFGPVEHFIFNELAKLMIGRKYSFENATLRPPKYEYHGLD